MGSQSRRVGQQGLQLLCDLHLVDEIQVFFRKVQTGFDLHPQMHECVFQCLDLIRERALHGAPGAAHRRFGVGIDQIGHRFGLRQIELLIQVGPLREFTGLGHAQAR